MPGIAISISTVEVMQMAVFVGVMGAALLSAIALIRERSRVAAENATLKTRLADANAGLQRCEAMLNLRDQRVVVWGPTTRSPKSSVPAARQRRSRGARRFPRLRAMADAAFGGDARTRRRGAAREGRALRFRRRDARRRAARGAGPQKLRPQHCALRFAVAGAAHAGEADAGEPAARRRPHHHARPSRRPQDAGVDPCRRRQAEMGQPAYAQAVDAADADTAVHEARNSSAARRARLSATGIASAPSSSRRSPPSSTATAANMR